MKEINILCIQYKTIPFDINANILKFRRIVKKYAYLRPDLVIFPEYSLTGPLYSNYHLAIEKDDKVFDELIELAQKYNTAIIPGSFIVKSKNQKFNSTCFINKNGKILGFYSKSILWSSEKEFLKKGDAVSVFNTEIGNVAVQICADLNSPKLSEETRKLKPHLFINIAMWSFEDKKSLSKYVPENFEIVQSENLIKARATENMCYAIFCNFGGQIKVKSKTGRAYPETSIGNTMIASPYGEIISKAETNKEEIVFAKIDLSRCQWRRKILI